MTQRRWMAGLLALFAIGPAIVIVMQPAGRADASVCVNAGRRVSVSGCANVGDAIARWAPPPGDYAPMPEDPPPPPPP